MCNDANPLIRERRIVGMACCAVRVFSGDSALVEPLVADITFRVDRNILRQVVVGCEGEIGTEGGLTERWWED